MIVPVEVTVEQVNDAIESTLSQADCLKASQTIDEIGEQIADWPLLQVYIQSEEQDITTANDRSSFGASVRQTELTFHADLFVAPRAHLAQNLGNMATYWSQISAILQEQDSTPAFGLTGIKSFNWRADRIYIDYAGQVYIVVRFTIIVRVF